MLSQSLLTSITKKKQKKNKKKTIISYSLVLGQQPLIAFQIQNFQKSIPIYLKIIRNFELEIISIEMLKNTNK